MLNIKMPILHSLIGVLYIVPLTCIPLILWV